MKKILKLIVVTLAVFLSGCGLIKEKRQLAISEVYTSLDSAASEVPSMLKLSRGDSLQIEISEGLSPRLKRGEHTDYFEVVEVEGAKETEFSLVLHAMCDCLGLRKWAVLSEVYLVSPSGKQVELHRSGLQSMTVAGEFKEMGPHKFIIIASSKYEGQKMGSIDGYLPLGKPAQVIELSLPLTVHPTGTLKVEYE
ncbi:hypothetical protein P3339_18720 [Microbulbifer sp. MLAF003]|uniref:hypothetical protein n=1 Tax=Microbulbifer sp. MLAF003 TaxID=3032582 RepID=UPI0024AE4B11|nr:hypothetical protein [Microbulbifer sp. MLAF003]WHI50453.1 hypothetical protein P3339_18720 [Microbulbifer sp. MLAF003]